MDEKPFLPLKTDSDVLFLYDYQDLNVDFDFSVYEKKTLIAFSYGVYAAGLAKENLPEFEEKIAINGTLIPVDDTYGVPFKKFMLSKKMDSETIVKFRERLFYNQEALEIFNQNLPKRSAQSCCDELVKIEEYVRTLPLPKMDFDRAFIGSYDRVIPPKNQLNFWNKAMTWKNDSVSPIMQIESGHFPFYTFSGIFNIVN